jgi:hypothetical protein
LLPDTPNKNLLREEKPEVTERKFKRDGVKIATTTFKPLLR